MDPTNYLIMAAALALGAVVKGATGMGLPLIALPVLTATFGLQHAVGLMVVPLIFTNIAQVWKFRTAHADQRMSFLPVFLVGGAAGIIIGTWLLTNLPERVLVVILGTLLLGYVGLRLVNPAFSISSSAARRLGPFAGLGGGILQGSTGISSPIVVTFIHAMGFERVGHVYAVSAMFLTYSLVQLPSLWIAGVMQPQWLLEGVLALVPIIAFMPVGQWLAGRLSRRAFDRLILVFLGTIGLKMLLGL